MVKQLGLLLPIINVVVEAPYWVPSETPDWNHISSIGLLVILSFHLSFPLRYPNPRTRTASLS